MDHLVSYETLIYIYNVYICTDSWCINMYKQSKDIKGIFGKSAIRLFDPWYSTLGIRMIANIFYFQNLPRANQSSPEIWQPHNWQFMNILVATNDMPTSSTREWDCGKLRWSMWHRIMKGLKGLKHGKTWRNMGKLGLRKRICATTCCGIYCGSAYCWSYCVKCISGLDNVQGLWGQRAQLW